jgi:transposase, IS5 family
MSTFIMLGAEDKLKGNKLMELRELIDWSAFRKKLLGIHKNDIDPQGGQKPYDHLKMLKAVLLKEWHSLSDKDMEEALRVRIDFMVFTGFDLAENMPDEAMICRFRNALSKKGPDKVIFGEINTQLEKHGFKLEKAAGAVIDATLIESSARPRRIINIEKDREETGDKIGIQESSDPDARWLKKGSKSYFGYKGFAVADTEGYIQDVSVESANVPEVSKLEEMLPSISAETLYADKGYASEDNRKLLKDKFKDGIMHNAARNHPLTDGQKEANKLISKIRYIIEQDFGTLKRRFDFTRASYMTRQKVVTQFRLKAICLNLLKAVNGMTLQECLY